MRSLLEKTIVHLLNGDEEKAAALFHKFMVEKARQLHESLRHDEEIDLGEGWDTEMKEEEYFDDGDLAAEDEPLAGDEAGDSMEDVEDMNTVDDDGTGEGSLDVGDADADVDMDDMGDGMDDGGTVDEKLDNIESKIEELTAEFDRLMGKFEDEGDVGDVDGLDDDLGGDDLPTDDFEDVEGEEPSMDAGDTDDLADRFDSDLSDEDKPESETMESVEVDEEDELDEDLADITESVLSELDKITLPSNTDGKEIGSAGKTVSGNRSSMLPHHNINDRIDGAKPYLVKGGNNDSFEREAAPSTKGINTMVDGVRKGNVRTSWKDTMNAVPAKGDNSALLNKDHAGSEPSPGSIIDGKTKPKTS